MEIAIGLFEGFTALDALGPFAVFTNLPDTAVVLCAATAGRVTDESGLLHVEVEHPFDEVTGPDVAVVPGGLVTRRIAADGGPVLDWIRRVHPGTTYTASVCTGALLLGAAGVLAGRRATTHWAARDRLARYGAEPSDERVVFDGRVVTGAGVSAGIDLALALAAASHGVGTAQAVQLGIEYDPQPPLAAGSPATAPPGVRDLVRQVLLDAEARLGAGP